MTCLGRNVLITGVWLMNAKLEKDELLRQLPVFKEMGMSGVCMHSRTGLATEYLGEEWFELINTCADEAERLGLEAWLYDEGHLARFGSIEGAALQPGEMAYRTVIVNDMETIRGTTHAPAGLPARSILTVSQPQPLAEPFGYELDEPNVCVLDFAAWRVGDGECQPEVEILRIEKALAEHHRVPARSGQMVQPWASKIAADGPSARVQLRFTFQIARLPENPVELLLEQPAKNRIAVNGRPVASTDHGWFIDPCFRRVPLPADALHEGDQWTDSYQLIPAGLLAAPEIRKA